MKAKHLHEIVKLADRFIKENKAKFKVNFINYDDLNAKLQYV